MLKKNDGYVMIYVMIVMLILGLVAGNALAAASHNAASEVNAVKQMKERYVAEGEFNKDIAALESAENLIMPYSYEIDLSKERTGLNSRSHNSIAVSERAISDVFKKKIEETLSKEYTEGKASIQFKVNETIGSVRIKATVLAVFTFKQTDSLIDDFDEDYIGDVRVKYTLETVETAIESFEVTQS